jgi:NAD+ kinase
MKIGIIFKKDRPEPADIVDGLLPWLKERGVEVFMEEHAARKMDVTPFALEETPPSVDFLLVLGGDGTMLRAARHVAGKDVPLLGINLGGLGFITEVYRQELYNALEIIMDGDCHREDRMMLSARVLRNGETIADLTALNDIVINNGTLASMIDMETHVNGAYVTLFKADGLITATPTGSTAYSLSSGGPILYPNLGGIVLTPICPHTLTNRPIVLSDDAVIEISIKTRGEGILLTQDGQVSLALNENDTVAISRSPHTTTLLMPFERSHFQVLREKLRWGERGGAH